MQVNIYWSSDGSGSPCHYLFDNEGAVTSYVGPNADYPETVEVIFTRPLPGTAMRSLHSLLHLLIMHTGATVEFKNFPANWA